MEAILVFVMLICSGLFAGGVLTIAWDRLPAWKKMDAQSFKADFGRTIAVADRLQPILLVGAIVTTGIFGFNRTGIEQILMLTATGGFAVTLFASIAILVPLQKRILASSDLPPRMYRTWQQGHMGRTVLSMFAFFSLALSLGILATN